MYVKRFFEIARRIAKKSSNYKRNYYLGAVGLRKDGTVVKSHNGAVVLGSENCRMKFPPAHAEFRLCGKLDKGSIVFVCRISRFDGSFLMSRPCVYCVQRMMSVGVKRVYYTISENEYGVMDL